MCIGRLAWLFCCTHDRQTHFKSNYLITYQFEDRVFNSIRMHGLAKPICPL